jgi:elongation factor 1 alpha-like protein
MSRHRNIRRAAYSFDEDYDDYYEEEEDDHHGHFQEGQLYSANDACAAAPGKGTENGGGGDALAQAVVIDEVKRMLGPNGSSLSKDAVEAAVREANFDPEVAQAILLSILSSPPPVPPVPTPAVPVAPAMPPPGLGPMEIGASGKLVPAGAILVAPSDQVEASSSPASSKRGTERSPARSAVTKVERSPTRGSPTRAGIMQSIIAMDDEGKEDSESDGDTPAGKQRLSLVVVGHVDAGKSTLLGQVLVQVGHVSKRALDKQERQAREQGKASFYLAWLMDEDEEERAHGVTIEIAEKYIETETKLLTLLDAPGHRDFIPNMISGASAADVAVLVIAATPGEFESGFDSNGQTKEHAVLIKALGVNQLVVAVNKLDLTVPTWSKIRFQEVKGIMSAFLREVGFKPNKLRFVPLSGLTGDNVKKLEPSCPLSKWYDGPTLLEAMDAFTAAPRATTKPMRMTCSDVSPTGKGLLVTGRLIQGRVRPNEKVLVMPVGDVATVQRVSRNGAQAMKGQAGDNVELALLGVDVNQLAVGNCLCKGRTPVPVAQKFTAQIATLPAMELPIIKGTQFSLHMHSLDVAVHCSKLVAITDTAGEVQRLKPRCIPADTIAHIVLTAEKPICVERYGDCRTLGRFVLRQKGVSAAVGFVLSIY